MDELISQGFINEAKEEFINKLKNFRDNVANGCPALIRDIEGIERDPVRFNWISEILEVDMNACSVQPLVSQSMGQISELLKTLENTGAPGEI